MRERAWWLTGEAEHAIDARQTSIAGYIGMYMGHQLSLNIKTGCVTRGVFTLDTCISQGRVCLMIGELHAPPHLLPYTA
jgi:hypothetical protein